MNGRYHPFANRVTYRIILVWVVLMALVSFFVFIVSQLAMLRQSRAHYEDTLELTDDRVTAMLRSVEVSAANIREGAERALLWNRDIYESLEQELRLNPDLVGCAVAFVPDYFPDRGHWFEPYVVRLPDGTFEHRQIGSASHDYFQSPWYTKAITREQGYWSEPYFDELGAVMMLCTYSLPLHDPEGNVVGVFGADVGLGWLSDQMRDIDLNANERLVVKPEPGDAAYSFILSREGVYVSHPDPARILARNYFDDFDPVLSKGDTTYLEIGRDMLAGEKGSALTTVDGVRSYLYYDPLEWIGWSMGIVVPRRTLIKPGVALGLVILLLMLLGMLGVFLVSYLTIRQSTQPIRELARSAQEVSKGKFDTPLPDIPHDDEIRLLRDSFADMERNLSKYVRELTKATAQKASLESELAIAREIQMAMLPQAFAPGPGCERVEIKTRLTPAKAVGGDLYDFHVRDGRLFFCIGDVSGKGIPAALIMSMTSSLFHSLSATEDTPEKIVAGIDASTRGRNESLMFVTVFVGILDLSTGVLSYCNAGHNAPVLVGKEVRALDVEPNIPIGVEENWPYKAQQVTLAPGTTLLLYTDGLTEAENENHMLYGEERMLDALGKLKSNAPEAVIDALSESVRQFVGKAEQSDDLTLLALRWKG